MYKQGISCHFHHNSSTTIISSLLYCRVAKNKLPVLHTEAKATASDIYIVEYCPEIKEQSTRGPENRINNGWMTATNVAIDDDSAGSQGGIEFIYMFGN